MGTQVRTCVLYQKTLGADRKVRIEDVGPEHGEECREEGQCVPVVFSTSQSWTEGTEPNRKQVHEWSRGELLPSETRST